MPPPPVPFDVVGLGANSLDYVYVLPGFPRPDSATAKLPITAHRLSPGGQVATTLATCAAFGLRSAYVGTIGTDDNALRVREALVGHGVELGLSVTRNGRNPFAVILIDEQQGERVVLWHRDAAFALALGEVPMREIAAARLLHVDDVDEEAAIAAGSAARRAGLPVTSDIDHVGSRTGELLDAVTIPIFAEHVPEALTGISDMATALAALRRPHHRFAGVTLGPRGAALLDGDRLHHSPACHVDVVDTTGAGDVFRGAFIVALLRGDSPMEILRFANAAAAIACTRSGAIASVPRMEEVGRLRRTGDGRQ